MKKIITFFFPLFLLFSFSPVFADCDWNGGEVGDALAGCAPANAITSGTDYKVE